MTWVSLAEAARSIPDGAWIAPGGYALGRAPMALVFELVRAKKRDLRVIALPDPLPAELLVAAGAAVRVELLSRVLAIADRPRPLPALARALERGAITWGEHDGYRIVQRLRAAAMGLPFIPAPHAGEHSTLEPPCYALDPFTGRRVPVERAFHPDVAIVHAQAADDAGNLYIEDPTTDLLVIGAATRVIATVEVRVECLPRVTVPASRIDMVAEARGGAWPLACCDHYLHDEAALLGYLEEAEGGRAASWIDSVLDAQQALGAA